MAENVYIWGNFKSILMMNTATNNGFHERQSIEEFLGEHEVVKELYEAARRSVGETPDRDRELLRAFNFAYYICMRLTDGSFCKVADVLTDSFNEWGKIVYHDIVFVLVQCLLILHTRFVHCHNMVMSELFEKVSDNLDWEDFICVTGKYCISLTKPFNFKGLPIETFVKREVLTDPVLLLERAASDMVKAQELVKIQLAAKDKYIKDLENQVKEQQEKVQARKDSIRELESQLEQLRKQNARFANNPFCLDKIKDYARGVDKEEAKVITHMLLTIALDEQLPKAKQAEVRKAVKEVEAAHRKQTSPYVHIERQEIHNDNKQSQVFNGSITDSKFGK